MLELADIEVHVPEIEGVVWDIGSSTDVTPTVTIHQIGTTSSRFDPEATAIVVERQVYNEPDQFLPLSAESARRAMRMSTAPSKLMGCDTDIWFANSGILIALVVEVETDGSDAGSLVIKVVTGRSLSTDSTAELLAAVLTESTTSEGITLAACTNPDLVRQAISTAIANE